MFGSSVIPLHFKFILHNDIELDEFIHKYSNSEITVTIGGSPFIIYNLEQKTLKFINTCIEII